MPPLPSGTNSPPESYLCMLATEDVRIHEPSDTLAALLGRTRSELDGRKLAELGHPADRHAVDAQLRRLVPGRDGRLECRFLQSDGEPIFVEAALCSEGSRWRVSAREVADFPALLADRAALRARLDLAVSPAAAVAWELHDDGRRLSWDEEAAELLGVVAASLPSDWEELTALVHADDQDGLRAAIEQLLAEGSAEVGIRVESGPAVRHLSFRGRMLGAGGLRTGPRAVGLLLDVTSEKLQEEQMMRLSISDALTGIRNRRGFDQALRANWRRCARSRDPLTVAIIDVDFFKTFNDTHGHLLGDEALVVIARTLAGAAERAGDTLARYGGEEFGVILPGVGVEGARVVLERMVASVREVRLAQAPDWRFSVSAGLASIYPGRDTIDTTELLARADKALYAAKRGGRGMLVVHELEATPRSSGTAPGRARALAS